MSAERLQQAYAALMERAPMGLFPRARQLYLNKYCFDGRETTSALRLFVKQEQSEERIENCLVEQQSRRRVIYTVRPLVLALVHWHQHDAAESGAVTAYLQSWGLDGAELKAQDEPWFREGGHQTLLAAPPELSWSKEALLPELSPPAP